MNNPLMDDILKNSKQRGTPLALLMALAYEADQTGIAAPTLSRLATMLNINKRNVSRNLGILKQSGEIDLVGTTARGVGRYEIRLDLPRGKK